MRKKYLFEYDMVFITILSVVLFIIPSLVVYGYYLVTREQSLNFLDQYFLNNIISDNIFRMIFTYLLFLVFIFLWMVLHEIIHGMFYIIKGAHKENIIYGAALEKGVFYCRCGEYIFKENIMTSLLAPFILIGLVTVILGMLFHSYLLMILSVVNISGAAGDIAVFIFFLNQKDPNLRFMEFGDSLTFVIESYDDLSLTNDKGVIFIKEIQSDSELPMNDNRHKIQISRGSYAIIFLFIILIAGLLAMSYFL